MGQQSKFMKLKPRKSRHARKNEFAIRNNISHETYKHIIYKSNGHETNKHIIYNSNVSLSNMYDPNI